MTRILLILALVLTLLLAVAGLMVYLAYGLDFSPPESAEVAGLSAPVEIAWVPGHAPTLSASTEADLYAALGYAHGTDRTWSLVLWRQAALGRLGTWFGEAVLPMDRLAGRLGWAETALSAYQALPPDDQAALHAYTAGLNAALADPNVPLSNAFVLLDQAPEPWAPWHTLAVERLFAWLAITPPTPDSAAAFSADVAALFADDDAMRHWLHLHDFDQSLTWAVRDSAGAYLFQRHVLGSLAQPVFYDVALRLEGQPDVLATTLPGTLAAPAGATASSAWAVLLRSTATLHYVPDDSTRPAYQHVRLQTETEREHLVNSQRDSLAFWFEPPLRPARPDSLPPPPDSTWTLRWAGMGAHADLGAWRALLRGEPPSFRLLDGTGLRLDEAGQWQVLGTNTPAAPFAQGILVGHTDWQPTLVAHLDSLTRGSRSPLPQRWLNDSYSPWAASLLPRLIGSAAAQTEPPSPQVEEALTYLRNWDARYTESSIGASIFETWAARYEAQTGHRPEASPIDSTRIPWHYRTLVDAVEVLNTALGDDLSQWRWGRLRPQDYRFAAWADTTAGARQLPGAARYTPIRLPGFGHPSTLLGGPSMLQDAPAAPTTWLGWTAPGTPPTLVSRQRRFDVERPLGRYLVPDRPPAPIRLQAAPEATTRTRLVPIAAPPPDDEASAPDDGAPPTDEASPTDDEAPSTPGENS